MTDQPGSSPWNNDVGPAPDAGADAPTALTPTIAPGAAGAPPPPSGQTNRLKVVVAINAVIILVGAVVIGVLLLKGDDDGTSVAMIDDRQSTTTIKASKSDGEADSDASTSTAATATTGAGQVKLAPKPTASPVTAAPTTPATTPATTQAPVTLPPPTQPAPPPVPSVDDALDQASTTLTEFMAADTRGDTEVAMSYLAPPVDHWVDQQNLDYDGLRADISDPDSDFSLSLIEGPTLAFGPEATPDGGWMVKVNYTMNANGEYLSEEGGWKCVNNDQRFLDTLVASPGETPRITSHEQVGEPVKYC